VIPIKTMYPNANHAKKLGFSFELESGLPQNRYLKIVPPTSLSFSPTEVYYGYVAEVILNNTGLVKGELTVSGGDWYVRFGSNEVYEDLVPNVQYGVWINANNPISEAKTFGPFQLYTVSIIDSNQQNEIIYDRNPIFGKITLVAEPIALNITVTRATGTNYDKVDKSYEVYF